MKILSKVFALSYASRVATLADRLKEIISEHRLSQHEFARMVGVTQPAVAGWLEGAIPYARTVNRICATFGVRRAWLMHGEGDKRSPKYARDNAAAELPGEYSLREKIMFIEERGTPEQLALVDSFLESVRTQLASAPGGKRARRTRGSSS